MLYWLYKYTELNIFQYITVRAGFAFFIAFLLCLYLMPKFIQWAKNKGAAQPIYTLAPSTHQTKTNTPTMGGMIFLISSIVASVLSVKLDNLYVLGAILTLILFGLIGIKDDLAKIIKEQNESGMSAKAKIFFQIAAAFVIAAFLMFAVKLNTDFYVPFYKFPLFSMGVFALFFWVLVMVSASNAVNLTDGLDGLATVPSMFSILTLSAFVYISGHAGLSSYLLLPKISAVGEVAIIGSALVGALMGFLWYNCHPAEIFMGDSGSLSLGAFIGYMAIVSKNEILLIVIGFVFVLETVSVILQVGSYRARKKRVFLMAPIHHHFEIKGWAENKIIVRFWIISLITNLIALITLKIR